MAPSTVALLFALLPLLTLAAQHPPHLRHRRHFESIRQVHADELNSRAVYPEQINEAHADAHRVIKREVAKRGNSCQPRETTSSTAADSATSSSTYTPTTTTATPDYVAAAVITSSTTASSSVDAQGAWAHGVSRVHSRIMQYPHENTDRPRLPRGLSPAPLGRPARPILGPLPLLAVPLVVPVACSLSPTSKYPLERFVAHLI